MWWGQLAFAVWRGEHMIFLTDLAAMTNWLTICWLSLFLMLVIDWTTATILRIYAKCVSWWPRGSTIFRSVICGLLTISQMRCKSQEVLTATCLVVLLVVLLAFLVLFIIFLVLNTGDDSSAMTGPVFNHKGWITTPTIISGMFRISNACGLSQPCWRA